MKDKIRATLVSATAFALVVSIGLSSCSKPAEQNASQQSATEPASNVSASAAPVANEQNVAAQDVSAQNAKKLLKAMSDYLAAQKAISLNYDSIFEVVSKDKQKLQLATSGSVLLNRPDKIHTTRKSGFSETEMVYDGKTLSLLGKGQNAYIQTEA